MSTATGQTSQTCDGLQAKKLVDKSLATGQTSHTFDGLQAKKLVDKSLEKIIKSIKGKAFPKLADLSVRKERPY